MATEVNPQYEFWSKFVQAVGLPIAATVAVSMIYLRTLDWEREKMLPALERSSTSLDTNTEVLRGFRMAIEKLPAQFRTELDREKQQRD